MQIMDFLQTLAFAGVTALIAVVYKHYLLLEPLHFFLKFGERWERRWFYKPIWGCPKCIAGQLALWLYALRLAGNRFDWLIHWPCPAEYSITGHIFAVCASIIFAAQLNIILQKQ